ncbi:hypothetical protein MHB48_14885 [Psychrobacillus sp. FSL H8-0483]|uniref:hypothetical protein n=1 Tax=Psychrobacillus sp. FSL H8-0483 TaxID=2921389 RepID=UPI00315AAD0B
MKPTWKPPQSDEFNMQRVNAASFGESIDNLPFIVEHPTKANHYYLLGYGGNGTVNRMLGSHFLRDLIIGKKTMMQRSFN